MADCRVLVIEDADDEAEVLLGHIERYGKEQGIRFIVKRLATAFEFAGTPTPEDLIFMDIDLPGISGMEAAEHLREQHDKTPLIFVTNLAQYAVKGYQVDALDFMVKPVAYGDFAMRMDRAMRAVEKNTKHTYALSTAEGMRMVDIESIVSIELMKHNLVFHLADTDETPQKRGSIKAVAEELPQDKFLLVSQGCLVNMEHVSSVAGDALALDDGTCVYFSRSRKRPCMEKLARYLGGTI